MARTVNVVVLTKSSKYKGYCVAGIDIDTGKWVRMVSNDSQSHGALSYQDLRYADGTTTDVLDQIQVSILDFKPSATQPENILIDESEYFIKKGTLSLSEVLKIHPPERHRALLGNYTYYLEPSEIDTVKHSLVLVKVDSISFNWKITSYGKEKLKINFYYNGKYYSNISVTDPDYYQVQNNSTMQSAIIVISLPDDDWSRENGYYKFVAKIFSL